MSVRQLNCEEDSQRYQQQQDASMVVGGVFHGPEMMWEVIWGGIEHFKLPLLGGELERKMSNHENGLFAVRQAAFALSARELAGSRAASSRLRLHAVHGKGRRTYLQANGGGAGTCGRGGSEDSLPGLALEASHSTYSRSRGIWYFDSTKSTKKRERVLPDTNLGSFHS